MTKKRIYELTEDTAPAAGDYLATDISGAGAALKVNLNKFVLADGSVAATKLALTEQSADVATASAGERVLFARDGNYIAEIDDGGYIHVLAWAGGETTQINTEPEPALWQHSAGGAGSNYGAIRIEIGNGTLSAGTLAVTFQQAFKTILEVFLQDKTAANAMYPSGLSTTGFTANGTTTDTFAWMAIGVD